MPIGISFIIQKFKSYYHLGQFFLTALISELWLKGEARSGLQVGRWVQVDTWKGNADSCDDVPVDAVGDREAVDEHDADGAAQLENAFD